MAMSTARKAAIAKSRAEAHAVKRYLLKLRQSRRPRVSRTRLEARLESLRRSMAEEANPQKYLQLLQRKIDLEQALGQESRGSDLAAAEQAFVTVASSYSDRKGLSYRAWRLAGVPAAVLKRAGITR